MGLLRLLLLESKFIGDSNVALVLGDNIFYGQHFSLRSLNAASKPRKGATIFGYHVKDPERFGVVEFDSQGMF